MSAHPSGEPQWLELTVHAAPAALEAVADLLSEVAPGAVSIEPAILPSSVADFEYALLDEPGLVRASVIGPLDDEVMRDLEARLAALPGAPAGPLTVLPLGEHDWAEEWKRFFHVLRVGRRIVIRPSWEPFDAAPEDVVIDLDPGSAFGTGQHETTRLCLAALEGAVAAGMNVLDLGAGSGILAIAAAKLGAGRVLALDVDAETVPVARENVRANEAAGRVRVEVGSVGAAWPSGLPVESFDLVVANISSTVLVALLPQFTPLLQPGGTLIASGFIEEGVPAVRAAIEAEGLEVATTHLEGDWRCLVAARPSRSA